MKRYFAMGAMALTVVVVTSVVGQDALKSGPPVGKNIPGAFHPLNVTGRDAGQKACLV